MVKIGAELPKLSQNKTGYPFLDHPVLLLLLSFITRDVCKSQIHDRRDYRDFRLVP